MIARLQSASSSDIPLLLRTSDDSGHGNDAPLSEQIAQVADAYAFVFSQLGIDASRPTGSAQAGQ
jgi:prolyl oligopeptidase